MKNLLKIGWSFTPKIGWSITQKILIRWIDQPLSSGAVREPAEISHSFKYYCRAREMMEPNQICVETKTRWLEQKRGTGQ